MQDRLAELEKVILDYYLAKGYQVGVGNWYFCVATSTCYKSKVLKIFFYKDFKAKEILEIVQETTKEMFDKAIEHFSLNNKPNLEIDYKAFGYESDGKE